VREVHAGPLPPHTTRHDYELARLIALTVPRCGTIDEVTAAVLRVLREAKLFTADFA
jgi:hypothetical protein